MNKYGGIYCTLGCQDLMFDEETQRVVPIPGGLGMAINHNGAFYGRDECVPTGMKLHVQVSLDFLSGVIDVAKITESAINNAAAAPKGLF